MPTQLTKEEEASAGGEDMEVRREDQEKINKFSSLHQKETNLEEELQAKIVSAAKPCSAFFYCIARLVNKGLVIICFHSLPDFRRRFH